MFLLEVYQRIRTNAPKKVTKNATEDTSSSELALYSTVCLLNLLAARSGQAFVAHKGGSIPDLHNDQCSEGPAEVSQARPTISLPLESCNGLISMC